MKSKRSKSKDQVEKQVKFEYIGNNLRSIKFFVEYTKDKQIKYILDGNILREQQIIDTKVQPEIMRNLEQVKYLRWEGELGKNKQKIKKWNAFWRESNLHFGGMYNENGQKQGKWVDLFPNFFEQIFHLLKLAYVKLLFKECINKVQNKENGFIILKINKQLMEFIMKMDKKMELGLNFAISIADQNILIVRDNSITYRGKYNNGVKFGRWDTYYQIDFFDEAKLIGGGEYNKQGEKNGSWIEIHEKDFSTCDLYFLGKYNHGKKQGKWETQFKNLTDDIEFYIIGGGSYDENELKTGLWIEIYENFNDISQIILEGEYIQGRKQGNQTTKFRLNQNHKFIIIGGGDYDNHGRKIGKWKDIIDNFSIENQVIETGEYENGKRKGKWITKYRYKIKETFIKFGEGIYDQEVKNGRWVEPFKNFQKYSFLLSDFGWRLFKRKQNRLMENFIKISRKREIQINRRRGLQERGFKNGQWLELIDNFTFSNQVILQGNYLNGKKLGQWDTLYKKNPKKDFKIIAGGLQNENCLKNGNWIDLDFGFCFGLNQVIFKGEYKNGVKTKEFEEEVQKQV